MNSEKSIRSYYVRNGRGKRAKKAFRKLHYIDEVHDMRGDIQTHLYGPVKVALDFNNNEALETEPVSAVEVRSGEYLQYLKNQPRSALSNENCYPNKDEHNLPAKEHTSMWFSSHASELLGGAPIVLHAYEYEYGSCSTIGCAFKLNVRGGLGANALCNYCYVKKYNE